MRMLIKIWRERLRINYHCIIEQKGDLHGLVDECNWEGQMYVHHPLDIARHDEFYMYSQNEGH